MFQVPGLPVAPGPAAANDPAFKLQSPSQLPARGQTVSVHTWWLTPGRGRRCAERRRTSYSMPPPTVTAPTGCQPPGPASGVARPSGRPGQPDPKFDSSRWLLRPGPGRATIPHEPGRRHGDQRTFKRNIEYKTDDGTECQLVHTLAHAIVYIVSVDELTFATKTDDDTECQLVHTLAHGIFCGYVSAAFSVAVEE